MGDGDLTPERVGRVDRAGFEGALRTLRGEGKMTVFKCLKEWEMEQREKEEKSQAAAEVSSEDDPLSDFERKVHVWFSSRGVLQEFAKTQEF